MIVMIKNYLLSRNDTSSLLEKENKNIDDMCFLQGHELYVKHLEEKAINVWHVLLVQMKNYME